MATAEEDFSMVREVAWERRQLKRVRKISGESRHRIENSLRCARRGRAKECDAVVNLYR
jgi:hypothetical protein